MRANGFVPAPNGPESLFDARFSAPSGPSVICMILFVVILARGSSTRADAPAQKVIDRVSSATAFVKQSQTGDGTAFCIRADGLFVTNVHVLQEMELLDEVPLIINSGSSGKEREVKAKLVSSNHQWDLALLKVDGRMDWPCLDIVDAEYEVRLGETAMAFGFPFGTAADPQGRNPAITMNQGRVSSLAHDDSGVLTDIRFDAAINPGNSGGPLVNEKGAVLGVVTARMPPPADRTSFAVGHKRLREFLKQPGLAFRGEVVPWDKRDTPMDFQIRVVTDFGATRPDSVEIELSADGKTKKVHRADLPADKNEIVISAAPDERKELKLLLRRTQSSGRPKEEELLQVDDRVIHPPSGKRLSDVARLIRMPNDRIGIDLRSGRLVRVDVKNLQDADKLLPRNVWDASTIHVDDQRAGYIDCTVRARKDDRILAESSVTFPLDQRPVFAQAPGDLPVLDGKGPLEELRIQTPMYGSVTFNIGQFGQKTENDDQSFTAVALFYQAGRNPPPGDFSLMGPFVRVNEKLWHYGVQTPRSRRPANFLPVALKDGVWDCEVVRDWSAGTTQKELLKGEVSVQHPEDRRTVVIVRTPKGKRATYRLRFYLRKE